MIKVVGREGVRNIDLQSGTVEDALKMLKFGHEKYVYLKNGVPVTADATFGPGDEMVFLEVFSGG